MIDLLDRNQIISHSIKKSEIQPAFSEIAKFISLSIVTKYLILHFYKGQLTPPTFEKSGVKLKIQS